MKYRLFLLLAISLTNITLQAQRFTQNIRGTVTDADGKIPIIGATVMLQDSTNNIGARTDIHGDFVLEHVPVGRVNLKITSVGFKTQFVPNIVVTSGKEVYLNIKMQENIQKLKKVVISSRKKGELNNEMTLISGNSITVDETQRFAGSFQDPSRMVSSLAGVSGLGSEFNNDLIVRGNSPKYVQWRLEGIEIPSPNHFSNFGGSGGAISALNSNLLATSDFYTGAFTAEYGDVLSGVMDMKLRNGNNNKREYSFGIGVLGMDGTVEGPFKKDYRGSYLANIRYSTLALAQKLKLFDATDGLPKYGDGAIKLFLPTKRFGTFSIFGLMGISTSGDAGIDTVSEFIGNDLFVNYQQPWSDEYNTNFYTACINHFLPFNDKVFLETTIAYSESQIWREELKSQYGYIVDSNENYVRDTSMASYRDIFNKTNIKTLRAATKLNVKVNAQHKVQFGTKFISARNNSFEEAYDNSTQQQVTTLDFDKSMNSVRSFVNWKYRVNDKLTLVTGVHHFLVLLTNENSIEPRVALKYQLNNKSALIAGYGKHSSLDAIGNYYAKVKMPNGTIAEPNKNLGLLKANHYILGFQRNLRKNLNLKAEVYYQELYNLPVENNDTSYFSTINQTSDFANVDLVNKGTGKNYGIELTLDKSIAKNYYYMLNASVYNSKYTALDNIERNTAYNSNYTFNALFGKEFINIGKKKNKVFGINGRLIYAGAKKIIPLLRNNNGELAVDPLNNRYYDYNKAYENGLDNLFQINCSASYKINRPKATHEFSVDVLNALNSKTRFAEYYDTNEQGNIGYVNQLNMIPNILYRIYF